MARGGDLGHVTRVLTANPAWIDEPLVRPGGNALYTACAFGRDQIAAWLLDNGADPDAAAVYDGETPLHLASKYGHLKCVRLLLQHGTTSTTKAVDRDGRVASAIVCATCLNPENMLHAAAIKSLFAKHTADTPQISAAAAAEARAAKIANLKQQQSGDVIAARVGRVSKKEMARQRDATTKKKTRKGEGAAVTKAGNSAPKVTVREEHEHDKAHLQHAGALLERAKRDAAGGGGGGGGGGGSGGGGGRIGASLRLQRDTCTTPATATAAAVLTAATAATSSSGGGNGGGGSSISVVCSATPVASPAATAASTLPPTAEVAAAEEGEAVDPQWILSTAAAGAAVRPLYWRANNAQTTRAMSQRHESKFMVPHLEQKLRGRLFRVGSRDHAQEECGRALVKATVTRVERVENSMLWSSYCTAKAALRERMQIFDFKIKELAKIAPNVELPADDVIDSTLNEFWLFHGTKPESAEVLATAGFDARVASLKGLFGAGSYFADTACKSMQYSRTANRHGEHCMLYCRVLVGSAYMTKQPDGWHQRPENARRPPLDPATPGLTHDSVFAATGVARGGKQLHNEYVVFNANHVYPEYIVWFKLPR